MTMVKKYIFFAFAVPAHIIIILQINKLKNSYQQLGITILGLTANTLVRSSWCGVLKISYFTPDY